MRPLEKEIRMTSSFRLPFCKMNIGWITMQYWRMMESSKWQQQLLRPFSSVLTIIYSWRWSPSYFLLQANIYPIHWDLNVTVMYMDLQLSQGINAADIVHDNTYQLSSVCIFWVSGSASILTGSHSVWTKLGCQVKERMHRLSFVLIILLQLHHHHTLIYL